MTLRGVQDVASARIFMDGQLADMPDPALLTDLELAAERLATACIRNESIHVHGDYDVDGVSSTALAVEFLRAIGTSCEPFIPHRIRDGYGISASTVDQIADAGCDVLLTTDCGVTAIEALTRAQQRGIDVLVLDHHKLTQQLPPAYAIVDPQREEEGAPHGPLCATGVVFMLLVALRRNLRNKEYFKVVAQPNLKNYMDLVALATVADMVPLVGTNRLLVRHGLGVLAARIRPAISALLDVSDVHLEDPVDAVTCAFRLAPRINAAGRLEDARMALDLLLSRDRGEASRMAGELDSINSQRRLLEDRILKEVLARVEGDPELESKRGIALCGESWHPGVLGIVATRVMQRFNRPTVLLTNDGTRCTGSARSIPGIDLVAALEQTAELLDRFGGHKGAAGLSLERSRFPEFQRRFERELFNNLAPEAFEPYLDVDQELPFEEVTEQLARELQRLAPFGVGNPEPLFCSRGVPVKGVRKVRRGALQMKLGAGAGVGAIAFRPPMPAEDMGRTVDIVFSISMRRFRGVDSLQVRIDDLSSGQESSKNE